MTCYRVTFYKHLLSSDGHPFRCLQQAFKIRCARNLNRAIVAAEHRFERRKHVPSWDLHADDLDVVIDDTGIDSISSSRPAEDDGRKQTAS